MACGCSSSRPVGDVSFGDLAGMPAGLFHASPGNAHRSVPRAGHAPGGVVFTAGFWGARPMCPSGRESDPSPDSGGDG